MSYAVIRSDSNSASASLTTSFASFTNPANSTAAAVTAFLLIPDLVDVLPSLALLTGVVLHSLNLRSSAHLLLIYLFHFPISLFLNKTVLAFLTRLAIL